jgi:hypothetical protein
MIEKEAFINFLTAAKEQGASVQEVAQVIKQASGEDVDPAQLEALMAHLSSQGGDPSQGTDPSALPPEHPAHPSHAHHGRPHQAPSVQDPSMGGDPSQGQGMPLSDEQIEQVAALVAQHLQAGGQQDSGMGEMAPEHQQNLAIAKTSEYISGFLKSASSKGYSIEDAVNFYGEALNNSIETCKVAFQKTAQVTKIASEVDEDTLAYFQGIGEKASADNLTYDQTLAILKEAGVDRLLKEKFTITK